MATEISTSFLSEGWMRAMDYKHFNVRFYPLRSLRLLPASCKKRRPNSGSQQKRQQNKKIFPRKPSRNANFEPALAEESDSENFNTDSISTVNPETESSDNIGTIVAAEHPNDINSNKLIFLKETQSASMDADGREQISDVHLQDLIAMIRHAEKNVHLLNQARICALEDLEKILGEKKALQSEINSLEMRLAETDARIRVASQEKIHVELLEDQLEKLHKELSSRGGTLGNVQDVYDIVPLSHNNSVQSLSEELNLLRNENISLKDDLQALKAELANVKGTGERVVMIEKEHSFFESSIKELERKFDVSQEDVSKLSNLKSECKSLWEKVEHLQTLLDKATKQADQAILVLQENQELRKKVERMEDSLEEANVYKLSSEKLQQYNELMQQKIKHLDERLQRSDEEIHSYVQLYQESVKEFQDTLNILREESKRRALHELADDMPREFWSHLLLIIDTWFLEKKIETGDANLLREMAWRRDGRIRDAYMECKEKTERETIATFLRLISLPTCSGLHVIHIAVEMAPVAKVGGLEDVLTGLSKALQKRGHLVEIILPKYDCMQYEHVRDLRCPILYKS